MGKVLGYVVTVVLVVGFLGTAYGFGFFGLAQIIYVGQLILGWTAYTVAIAIVYWGLEKLFPNFLCAASHEEKQAQGDAGPAGRT